MPFPAGLAKGRFWARAVLALSLLTAASCQGPPSQTDIYELKLPDPEGLVYDLSADRGRVVLVMYWATWCGACKKELPLLKELRQKYASQGLTVLAWAIDSEPWAEQTVKTFIKNNQVGVKVLMVKDHLAETVGRDQIKAVPTFKLYGRDGRLLDSLTGGAQKGYWEVAVIRALRS